MPRYVLLQMAIYLAAAVVAVPLSQRLGFGSVLGYLAAGMAIGPALGLVGSETEHVQDYAEYGVVLMLFLIGLEMRPRMLWEMRHRLLGPRRAAGGADHRAARRGAWAGSGCGGTRRWRSGSSCRSPRRRS